MIREVPPVPRYLSVSVTWKCTYACPGCFHGQGSLRPIVEKMPEFMPFERFKMIVDELKPHRPKLGIYSDGENFLHPDIYDMIEYSQNNGMPVEMDTTGCVMDPVRLAATNVADIIVSIDGFSQEAYAAYRRRGRFENARKRLTRLAEEVARIGGRTNIIVKFLVNAYTEDDIDKAHAYYSALPNVTFKLDFFHPPIPGEDLATSWHVCPIESYEHWRPKKRREFDVWAPLGDGRRAGLKVMRNSRTADCENLYRTCFIETDGSMFACRPACNHFFFHGPSESWFGNVFTDGGVLKVFHGERAQNYRRLFAEREGNYALCSSCDRNRGVSTRELGDEAASGYGFETMASGLKKTEPRNCSEPII